MLLFSGEKKREKRKKREVVVCVIIGIRIQRVHNGTGKLA